MATLLRPGTTYLPYRFSRPALERFGIGKPSWLLRELQGRGDTYERVGIDRALAIAIDLACLGAASTSRILDVGCSVGTISLLLSEIGYTVTGIDSDVVAEVQGWQEPSRLTSARAQQESPRCRLLHVDLRTHLKESDESYDVGLLLSVLHHWLQGYGYTGTAEFDREEVRDTLVTLCGRVRRCLYVEVPIEDELAEMPPDPAGEFVFPDWFVTTGLASGAEHIASTIATNGKPRRLYRVDLR